MICDASPTNLLIHLPQLPASRAWQVKASLRKLVKDVQDVEEKKKHHLETSGLMSRAVASAFEKAAQVHQRATRFALLVRRLHIMPLMVLGFFIPQHTPIAASHLPIRFCPGLGECRRRNSCWKRKTSSRGCDIPTTLPLPAAASLPSRRGWGACCASAT